MSPPSPCIGVCRIHDGVCAGCYRSLHEIAEWPAANADRKREIKQSALQRRGQVGPPTVDDPARNDDRPG